MRIALATAPTAPLKEQAAKLGVSLVALYAALQIAFYRESPLVTAGVAAGLFFLFALPGYLLLNPWRVRLVFLERLVGGALIASAIFIGIAYYSGLAGLNAKYATWLVPLALYTCGIALVLRERTKRRRHGTA